MNKLFILCIVALLIAPRVHAETAGLVVMSFNIRCGSCEKPADINFWGKRKTLVEELIRRQQPDLLGLQEAELFQVRDLIGGLPDYGWVGVGRDDGKEVGETTAILFKLKRFVLTEQQTYWLSETPAVPGKGWDAALPRTVTVASLRDRLTDHQLVLLNAHLDHKGERARVESSKLIVSLATSMGGDVPVIVTGDFNYTQSFEGYSLITAALRDAERAGLSPPEGGNMSFNNFGRDMVPANKIDFIFVNDRVTVATHKLITERFNDRFASDHFPLVVSLHYK